MAEELDLEKILREQLAEYERALERNKWLAEGANEYYRRIRKCAERLQPTGAAPEKQPQSAAAINATRGSSGGTGT